MYYIYIYISMGFPGGANGKELACQCRRHKRCRLDPWVGKIPWRRAWQPTPVFLPGESHGQRSLEGYHPLGLQRVRYYLSDLVFMHSSALKDTVRKQTLIAALLTCKYSLYFLHRAPGVFKCSLLIPCIPQALALHSFLPLYRMAWDCA